VTRVSSATTPQQFAPPLAVALILLLDRQHILGA